MAFANVSALVWMDFHSTWGPPIASCGAPHLLDPLCQSCWDSQLGAIKSHQALSNLQCWVSWLKRWFCCLWWGKVPHLTPPFKTWETTTQLPGMRILACQWGDKFGTIGAFGWSGYIGWAKGAESNSYMLLCSCWLILQQKRTKLTSTLATTYSTKRNHLETETAHRVCTTNWLFTVPVWVFQRPWLAHRQNFDDEQQTASTYAYRKPASREVFQLPEGKQHR